MMEAIRDDQRCSRWPTSRTCRASSGALAMPDIHWGYGFCIGGVAATDPDEGGVISPGGVGYDINCGVRLLRSNLDVRRRQAAASAQLVDAALPRHPDRRRPGGQVPAFDEPRARAADGARAPRTSSSRGWARDARPRVHRGRRPARRRRARPRSATARLRARRRPVRHARLGQPLPRSAGRRPRLRRARPRASWAWRGTGLRDDPLAARAGWATRSATTPCGDAPRARREVRHRAARPAARLRAGATAPKGSATSARCARRPTSPGATASC